jgi:hypothetical protein
VRCFFFQIFAVSFIKFSSVFSGSIDLASQPVTVVLNLLANYSGDLYGCLSNCSGSGQCFLTSALKFECECKEHFRGIACEENLHPCAKKSICLNGGKCIEYSDGLEPETLSFECNCTKSFLGTHCENRIDICANTTCSGHGKCYDNSSQPACECYKGYLGDKCDQKSEALIALQKKVTTFSYVAFVTLGVCYTTFVLMDLLKIVMNVETKRTPRIKNKNPIRYLYKEFD